MYIKFDNYLIEKIKKYSIYDETDKLQINDVKEIILDLINEIDRLEEKLDEQKGL